MKKLFATVVIALSIGVACASTSHASTNDLTVETTPYLCEALGFVVAGGMGNPQQDHVVRLVEEITSRKDYNQGVCNALFNKGAVKAANWNLESVLGE